MNDFITIATIIALAAVAGVVAFCLWQVVDRVWNGLSFKFAKLTCGLNRNREVGLD